MSIDFGGVPAGSVLPIIFDTFAGATGAPVTITGLAAGDIEVYKGTSMTQRASDNGFTLLDTDGIDIDSRTGIHGFSIDTGDNSDSGFYAAGSFYTVIVDAVTVDSQTVRFVAATFRLVAAESVAGTPKADASHIAGSAVSTSTAQIGVNVVNAAGTAWASGALTSGVFAAGAINAAAIADNAIDRATFAADTGLQSSRSGTAQAGAAGTVTLDASASSTTDFYAGMWIRLTGGTGAGQARVCTAYNGTTKVATVAPNWATNPDNTSTFAVLTAAQITGVQGNVTGSVASVSGAVGSVTGNVGGNVTGSVGSVASGGITSASFGTGAITATAIAADAIGASELASDAITEIQSGLATAAALATVDGIVDTIVATTDKLDDTLEDDGGTFRFTANALEEGPSGSGLDAAGVRAAVGLASANLDTQLSTIDTVVDSILADTGTDGVVVASINNNAITANSIAANAITDAKVASDVTIASVTGSVGSVAGNVDGSVASVATGGISSGSFASGAITATAIATDAIGAAELADGAITAATFAAGAIDATAIASGAITAAKIATDAIDADALAADAVAEIQSGLATASALATVDTVVDSILVDTAEIGAAGAGLSAVPWNAAWDAEVQSEATDALNAYDPPTKAELDSAVAPLATAANLATVDTVVDSILAGLGIIRSNTAQAGAATTITLDTGASSTNDFYNNTLVWLTGGTGAGQARFITDYVGSTRVATVDTWITNPDNTTTFTILAFGAIPGASAPTAAQVADAVWQEALADHSGVSGSTAEQLAAAGAAGDPWATALPGSYTSGQAGKIIGDNINATVGSRATQTSVDTIDDFLDTEVAAIKAKTDNLPSDPADASDIAASFSTVNTKLDTIDDLLDTEVAAIKADTAAILADTGTDGVVVASIATGAITADAIAANAIGASELAADAVTEIQSGLATAASIAALNNLSAAQVNTEVDTALSDYGALRPTTAGRTLDVTAAGNAGIDWGNVENPTTAVNLSATNIDPDQVVASVSGAVGSVTGAVGSVTGNVGGNVAGSVGSVTTVSDKTGYRLSATGVDDILDEAITEPAGVFTWPATLRGIVGWLGALGRNKVTMTATTQTLRNDADNASIATSTQSDDGTTYSRGEWS